MSALSTVTTRYRRRMFALALVGVVLSGCGADDRGEVAHRTIGLITNNVNGLRNVEGFKAGMTRLGYEEGKNVTYRYAGRPVPDPQLDAAIGEMVKARVDLIFTAGTPTGVSAHRVTKGTGIPVVFGVIADPVAAGVMTNLTRPGGNMTGVRLSENQDRRLQLLLELVPGIRRVLVPVNPEDSANVSAVTQIKLVAPALGVKLLIPEVRNSDQVLAMLRDMRERVDAVFLVPGTTVNARFADVAEFARARRIPISAPSTIQVEEGAFTTYGFIHYQTGVQAARIADQILKGGAPSDIPVEDAEFFLSINLEAAKAIGLKIPNAILKRADFLVRPRHARTSSGAKP